MGLVTSTTAWTREVKRSRKASVMNKDSESMRREQSIEEQLQTGPSLFVQYIQFEACRERLAQSIPPASPSFQLRDFQQERGTFFEAIVVIKHQAPSSKLSGPRSWSLELSRASVSQTSVTSAMFPRTCHTCFVASAPSILVSWCLVSDGSFESFCIPNIADSPHVSEDLSRLSCDN